MARVIPITRSILPRALGGDNKRLPCKRERTSRRAFPLKTIDQLEDLPVAEQCQRGLAGARDLLLGRNEPLLQFWHRLWDEAAAP
jgi:hypothetical protein